MNRKAVFFDIDGTIVDRKNQMPKSAAAAIRALRKNGHLAFLCSGRSRGYIQNPQLLDIGFDGIISGCGTMIEYHGETLYYVELDKALAEHTVRTVRRYGFRPILEGKYYLYMDVEDFGLDDDYGNKLRAELGDHLRTVEEDWGNWEISKLSCATENLDTEACFEELSAHYDYIIHNSAVVEMVPKGHDKKTGIEMICRHLGVDRTDTIAFGDSANDLGMFAAVNTAVVMGDGFDVAKQAADYITTGIWEDGIWNACRHLGLI